MWQSRHSHRVHRHRMHNATHRPKPRPQPINNKAPGDHLARASGAECMATGRENVHRAPRSKTSGNSNGSNSSQQHRWQRRHYKLCQEWQCSKDRSQYPPSPPAWGDSQWWGPRPCTQPSPQAAPTMHLGPRRIGAADAPKCTGAGSLARRGSIATLSNPSRNQSPNSQSSPSLSISPSPSPSPSLHPSRPCEGGGEGGGDGDRDADGSAVALRHLGTVITDLGPGLYTLQPKALAVHRWAEDTVSNWTRELRSLGRTALLRHEKTTAEALAIHLTKMAAEGRRSATLRGVVSSIRMVKRLELVPTRVRPLHWLLCEDWGAPPTLPWPRPDGGVLYRATGVMDMWPMGTIFGVADSTAPKRGKRRGSGRKLGPYVISDSSDSSDVQGILGSAAAAMRVPKPKPRARPKAHPKPARGDAPVRATNAAVPQVPSDASPRASPQRA